MGWRDICILCTNILATYVKTQYVYSGTYFIIIYIKSV